MRSSPRRSCSTPICPSSEMDGSVLPSRARRPHVVSVPNRGRFTRGQGFARARTARAESTVGRAPFTFPTSGRWQVRVANYPGCGSSVDARPCVWVRVRAARPTPAPGRVRRTGPARMCAAVSRRRVRSRIPEVSTARRSAASRRGHCHSCRRAQAGVATTLRCSTASSGRRSRSSSRRRLPGAPFHASRTARLDAPARLATGPRRPDVVRHRRSAVGRGLRLPGAGLLADSGRPARRCLDVGSAPNGP